MLNNMKFGRMLKKIGFTPANAKKLLRQQAAQFKPEQLEGTLGELAQVALKAPAVKKIEKAIMGGKMCRLCMGDFDMDDEIDGEGFKDFLKKVSRGAKKAAKTVARTTKKIGREIALPALERVKEAVVDEAIAKVPGLSAIKKLTGGAMVMVPYESWQTLIGPSHPAYHPPRPSVGFGEYGSYEPKKPMSAGSFKVL